MLKVYRIFSCFTNPNIISVCMSHIERSRYLHKRLYTHITRLRHDILIGGVADSYGGRVVLYNEVKMRLVMDVMNLTLVVADMFAANYPSSRIRKIIDEERERLWREVL